MSEHKTGNLENASAKMADDDLEGAIASLQDQLDFLVKILRALDEQPRRKSATRAEYEDKVLQQIADLTQKVVLLMEQRKKPSGDPGHDAGDGSRTTLTPHGDPNATQDALLVMRRNVPLEEIERDRLIAAEKAENLRRRAFQEQQSRLRAERERRFAARTKRLLRRWLGLSRN